MSASQPVAFSLSAPLFATTREARRHPGRSILPVLVLLLPALPLLAGLDLLLREGGSAALQGWIAGAPAGTPNALIAKPDGAGWWTLAGIGALLVGLVGTVLAAGLVPGAVAGAAEGAPTSAFGGLRASASQWPALVVALVGQLLLLAVVSAVVVVVAVYTGKVRFQLGTVVLFFGLGALAIATIRASLWPAIAVETGQPARAAMQESWRLTRGSVIRLLGAAVVTGGLVLAPALLLRAAVRTGLTALADQAVIALSPIAIDLLALLTLPVAAVVLVVLWGQQAPQLVAAMRVHRAELDQPANAS